MLVIQSKKTDYNTEISETESKITTDHDSDKYITIHEFYKLQQNILLQDQKKSKFSKQK